MNKKAKQESAKATRASVRKEMAKPRMSKSVREAAINPSAARLALAKR